MKETIKRVEGIAERTEKEFKVLMEVAEQLGKQTKLSCHEVHVVSKTLAELGIPLTDSKDVIQKLINLFKHKPYKLGGLADMKESKEISQATYECLVCGHGGTVIYNKDTYMEVRPCPNCCGAYVDLWKIHKYKHLIRSAEDKVNDYKETVDKAMRETAKELMDQWGGNCVKSSRKPLLTIELENETAVPKVLYKGEEIIFRRNVYFDWDQDTDVPGGLTYAIEHYERGNGNGLGAVNRIERRVGSHAAD